ncbi:MAG TPA: hypothetical protein PLV92_17205, partial [Pirellulaceae bacterium]|nr:hypothetical protein [Pirellulaceae bacterium]
ATNLFTNGTRSLGISVVMHDWHRTGLETRHGVETPSYHRLSLRDRIAANARLRLQLVLHSPDDVGGRCG